jgi:hypothetical protein
MPFIYLLLGLSLDAQTVVANFSSASTLEISYVLTPIVLETLSISSFLRFCTVFLAFSS